MADSKWKLDHLTMAVQRSGVDVEELRLPAEHDLLADGIRLHYLDWGGEAKPPILFLHGGGLTAHTWDVVCLALTTDYRCVALDLRGHGDSEWSPNMQYGIEFHSGDIGALADHLGLGQFALTGMSLGGLAAIAHAADHKQRVAALTIVDVAPTVTVAGANRIKDFMVGADEPRTLDEYIELALKFNPRRNREMLRLSLLHNLLPLPDDRWMWKYDRRHVGRSEFYDADRRRLQLWSDVSAVNCPTLVIRGSNSDFLSDEDARQLAGALPDGRLVTIPEAGHTVQGDNPRVLVAELSAFLTSITPWGRPR